MSLDLGALAKGYIADNIMAYLIEDGVEFALINLGGNVLVHGPNPKSPDKTFRIGIQEPVPDEASTWDSSRSTITL